MTSELLTALIAAISAILISSGTFFFTKKAERAAIWRSKKLAYYEEFFEAASAVTAGKSEAKTRFSISVNNLHLVGSPNVITTLHQFIDEIHVENSDFNKERHDCIWSRLVWEIRTDLNDSPSQDPAVFRARLYASGGR